MASSNSEVSGGLRLVWSAAGLLSHGAEGKISFPKLQAVGGLYKFSVRRRDGSQAVYVGETENLQRRFAHYRNPGPTQTTNQRMNGLFVEVLASGGEIHLATVTDKVWIVLNGQEVPADLARKDVRRLFENFVLATQNVSEVECLNR
jgi:hypothetical protein